MKNRYLILWFLVCLLSPFILSAQYKQVHIKYGCHYANTAEEKEYFTYDPLESEQEILERILNRINIDYAEFELRASNVGNAIATEEDGIRYILYDPLFISQVVRNSENKWSVYSILAHEIGHHVYGHDFHETDPALRKEMELKADDFSGRILNSLCANEDDALAAINTLSPRDVSPNYPVLSARQAKIIDGWYTQKEIWEREGVNPCGEELPLNFGEQYRKNRANNVLAFITEDKMEITFTAKHPNASQRKCESFLMTSPYLGITPKSLEWRSDPHAFGNQQKLIWHFKKDHYTKEEVKLADDLGIGVFEPSKVPKSMEFKHFIAPVSVTATGGVFLYLGFDKKQLADDKYDLHRINKDIGSPLFIERDQLFTDANDLLDESQTLKTIGYTLAGIGLTYLADRLIRVKRSKKGRLYQGIR